MKKEVFAYLHTHWDREWYRNKEDFNIRLLDVFDIVIDELTSNRAPFFYFDGQTIALLDYLKYRSDKTETIKKLIKQNKLAIGPYFVSADSYLVNFSSMLKNLEIGLKISKDFGQKDYIGYMADIFGISNSAFEALKLNNINYAVIWRGVNPKKIKNNVDFIKNGINTVWLAQGYFNDFLHTGNIEGLEKYLDKISKYSKNKILLPIGADHLGMLKNSKQIINDVNRKLNKYKIVLTSPFEYFKNTKFENICKEKEFLDNSDTYILPGVYSTRLHQKILNNKVQNLLSRVVEPLNYMLKERYTENIDFIYKTLIKNHAHDGIYGCSVDEVARTVDSRFEKCLNASESVLKNIISNFKKENKISGKTGDFIGIFNLSNSKNNIFRVKTPYKIKNSQIISKEKAFPDDILYDVYQIPVTEQITTIYTSLIQTEQVNCFEFHTAKILKPRKKTIITEKSIENENIKLYIKNNKIFIQNKKDKNKVELTISDIMDGGDSYNYAPIGNYKILDLIKTKIKYDGIIESCLEMHFKNIKLKAIVNNDSKYINFEVDVLNKNKNHKLQINFKLNEFIYKTIAEDAIGITERKIDPEYNFNKSIPAKYPKELKTNSFPMQSFVNANNFNILTKGLHEYEIYKNELRICILRSTDTISNPKNPARAIPAGPNLTCIDSQYLNKEISLNFGILFGNYKKAYDNLDIFNEIYAAVDGNYKYKKCIKLMTNSKDSYIYGISNGHKISYNIDNRSVKLI